MTVHIYGQQLWHDDATIIGTKDSLLQLRKMIDDSLSDLKLNQEAKDLNLNQTLEAIGISLGDKPFFTSDGEGFRITVITMPDDNSRWDRLAMPYLDTEFCSIKDDELVWTRGQGFVEYGTLGGTPNNCLSIEMRIANWLLGNDTGTASKTMAAIGIGLTTGDVGIPRDIGELGSCYRLVQAVPEIINKILMRPIDSIGYKEILPFVWQWHQLARLYEIFLEDADSQSENTLLLRHFIAQLANCGGNMEKASNALQLAKLKTHPNWKGYEQC